MTGRFDFGGEVVWRPTPEYVERSHLMRFMNAHGIESFADLMERSTGDVAWFTKAVLRHLDIEFQHPYSQVVDLSGGIQRPDWCVGGRLNIAHNCVDKWAANARTSDRTALIWEGEQEDTRTLTYGELGREVNRCANSVSAGGMRWASICP